MALLGCNFSSLTLQSAEKPGAVFRWAKSTRPIATQGWIISHVPASCRMVKTFQASMYHLLAGAAALPGHQHNRACRCRPNAARLWRTSTAVSPGRWAICAALISDIAKSFIAQKWRADDISLSLVVGRGSRSSGCHRLAGPCSSRHPTAPWSSCWEGWHTACPQHQASTDCNPDTALPWSWAAVGQGMMTSSWHVRVQCGGAGRSI